MVSEHYPYVKYPTAVQSAKQFIPAKPTKPSPLKEIQLPTPKRIDTEGVSCGCLLGGGIAIFVSFFTNNINLALIALFTAPFIISYLTYDSRVSQYKKAQEENRRQKEEFAKDNERYNEETARYQALIDDKQKIKELRLSRIKEALELTEPPDGENSQAQRGWSEGTFFKYLLKCFPGKIHQGVSLKIPNFLHPYTPDFCYTDGHLYIDIEIDEPYAFQSKDPCHYTESKTDRQRDSFFLDKNWTVIRFSEEQVHRHPLQCCRFIFDVIDGLIKVETPEILKDVDSVETQQRWDKSEAQHMASTSYRDSYLR